MSTEDKSSNYDFEFAEGVTFTPLEFSRLLRLREGYDKSLLVSTESSTVSRVNSELLPSKRKTRGSHTKAWVVSVLGSLAALGIVSFPVSSPQVTSPEDLRAVALNRPTRVTHDSLIPPIPVKNPLAATPDTSKKPFNLP